MGSIAIVVGNSEYQNSTNLDCCLADVAAITDLLRATGKYSSIKQLTNEKAAVLKDKIRAVLEDSGTVDELFFYFSGHGYQNAGEFYFNATNFDATRPNETGLSQSELHTLLRGANANLVVKVIDACSSGTLLLKSDGGFLPEPKDGFGNFIQIASCLDDQSSLTGNPLSDFTDSFYDAALSKEAGVVYYSDIINALRDRFLDNNAQTPHFVLQGTGREVFVDNAEELKQLRAKRLEQVVSEDVAEGEDAQDQEPPLSAVDQLKLLEESYVDRDAAQNFISVFFDNIISELETLSEFEEFFDCEHVEHDDFDEADATEFITRVLHKEKRPDNFVTAEISRERAAHPFGRFNLGIASLLPSSETVTKYDLRLNCKMERVQLKVTFTPRFKSLKQFSLIVSCAPSLDACYIFEVVTRHALNDWGAFEPEGHEVNRRWYKLGWNESTDGMVEKFRAFLQETIDGHVQTVLAQADSSRGG